MTAIGPFLKVQPVLLTSSYEKIVTPPTEKLAESMFPVLVLPEPGAAPFVEIGARVSEGDPLLIIEAMKTMNQIPAPNAGKVSAILFENGQPVEFGEPLIIIE